MPTSIANCWKKRTGKDNSTADKMKLIPLSKQDMKATCDELGTILQADDLLSLTEVDEETICEYLNEYNTAASVKNGKTTNKLQASDKESDSEDNCDDPCEVVVPKLNKMLENINKVMTRLEEQTDSEHIHLLHLVNITQYVPKKHNNHFQQTTSHNYFYKEKYM
jgi:hypothetical protein